MKISPSTVINKAKYPTLTALAATVAVTSCSQQQLDFVLDSVFLGSQQQQGGVAPMSDTIPVYEVSTTGEHIYKGEVPRNHVETQLIPGRQRVLPQNISGAQVVPTHHQQAQ